MSKNSNGQPAAPADITKDQQKYKAPTIIIELQADGTVNVSAPFGDKILCYGMLKMAENAVARFEVPSGIVRPGAKAQPPLKLN